MKPVQRTDLLDYVTYETERERMRAEVLAIKAPRRVHLAGVLTFLFENTATIRYQIQEMIRAERMVREADIRHELSTYNELLGAPGELGATLLIEIVDAEERARKLAQWLELPRALYLRMPGKHLVRARFDERQVGDERLSSVHYLKFDVRGEVPWAVGSDLPGFTAEVELSAAARAALAEDLRSDL
ncbi:MAG: DUF3501 family protein [Planctomycetes bacterium]|jgi:hypothetical protein|nr:DUF3501 family protein [Planctomycetota bacterium]